MKKNTFLLATCLSAATLWSCNDNSNSKASDTNNTTSTDTSVTGTPSMNTTDTTNNMAPGANANKTPLTGQDSIFVMKAAAGGLMEVQAGQLAQQKATNERVKAFAAMMVNDHTKANQELMSMASGRGMTIPQALPPDMQKHMDAMQKMEGKAFDRHYMSMMVNDHKKTVTDFEKQANGGQDADLKGWAGKTLPILQMHRDSAQAISKAKM